MRFKLRSLAIVVLASTLTITGCQSAVHSDNTPVTKENPSEIKGTLTFISSRNDLVEKKFFDKYVEGFKKKYPAVKEVKVIALKDYQTEIRVRILSNNYEDVLILPNNFEKKNLPEYFEPLDELGLKDKLYFADEYNFEGKNYAITTGVAVEGLLYNKKAFKQAGIEKPPTSLNELYKSSEKLKQAGIIPIYANYASGWTLKQWGGLLSPVLNANPGSLQFMSQTDAPFQVDNELGKSYGVLHHLIEKGFVEPDLFTDRWEESKVAIATGKAGMYYMGSWVISQVLDKKETGVQAEDLGFAPFPSITGEKQFALMSPDYYYVINKNSKNLPAAKAWVKYLLEESSFADDAGFMQTIKSRESSIPQLKEFMSYKPTLLESVSLDEDYGSISQKAGFSLYDGKMIQEFAISKSLQTEFDKWNAKWKQARQAYLKEKGK
ncbi:ABC transporter substrate-binding protein [Paenibacillus sp. SI8]|uniref:ABC transporter substrate-binding protein n=1 Tax=unclassified Paenibacillus TaxID=185978 RepID=UPI00346556A3